MPRPKLRVLVLGGTFGGALLAAVTSKFAVARLMGNDQQPPPGAGDRLGEDRGGGNSNEGQRTWPSPSRKPELIVSALVAVALLLLIIFHREWIGVGTGSLSARAVNDLVDFDTAAAGVAAGMFALMLAAVQFREEIWALNRLRRAWAVAALVEFLIVLGVASVALAPGHPVRLGLLLGGAVGVVSAGCQWRTYLAAPRWARKRFDFWQSLGASITFIVCGGLVVLSLLPTWTSAGRDELMLTGFAPALTLWLLASGSFEVVWVLMFSVDVDS